MEIYVKWGCFIVVYNGANSPVKDHNISLLRQHSKTTWMTKSFNRSLLRIEN